MQTFKKLTSLSLIFILASSFLPLSGSMLQNIDQTYQILPQENKKFSITNGAIAWETGWLNNFHRFANFYPVENIDRRGRKVIGYDPQQTDNVTKLVQILFYRVPGSTSYTDFSTTDFVKPKGSEAANKIAVLIANIVFGLDQLSATAQASKQAKENLDKQLEIVKKDEKISKNKLTAPILKKFEDSIANFEKTHNVKALEAAQKAAFGGKEFSPFNKQSTPEFFKAFEEYNQKGQGYANWINSAQALLELNPKKFLMISSEDFTKIVIDALHESNPNNLDALYPEQLVHMIWLGFLYKAIQKASGTDSVKNRIAMQAYYDTLGKLLNKKLDLPEVSLPTVIRPSNAQEKVTEFLTNPALASKELDSFLFYSAKSRLFPRLTGYATAYYKPFPEQIKPFDFADCMDNSIANFIRIMSYDMNLGTYSLTTLEKHLGITITTHRDALEQFLKNPSDHDAWAALISNIPYVPYWQVGKKNGSSIEGKGKPFMHVDELYKDEYERAGYKPITSPDEVLFELHPSIRTLITALNYIFDLGLFDKPAQDNLRPDFVAHYFPLLCNKLHLEGYYALTAQATIQEENINIDKFDQQGRHTVFAFFISKLPEFENQDARHIFETTSGHGTYHFDFATPTFNLARLFESELWLNNNLVADYTKVLTIALALLLENLLEFTADTILNQTSFQQQYIALFALPLYNPDEAINLIKKLSTQLGYGPKFIQHPYVDLLILKLASIQPDIQRYYDILDQLISSPSSTEKTYKLIHQAALDLMTTPEAATSSIHVGLQVLIKLLTTEKIDTATIQKDIETILIPIFIQKPDSYWMLFSEMNLPHNPIPIDFILPILEPLMVTTKVPFLKIIIDETGQEVKIQNSMPLFEGFLPIIKQLTNPKKFHMLSIDEQNTLKKMIQLAVQNFATIVFDKHKNILLELHKHINSDDLLKVAQSTIANALQTPDYATANPLFTFLLNLIQAKQDEKLLLQVADEMAQGFKSSNPEAQLLALDMLVHLAKQNPNHQLLEFLKQQQNNIPIDNSEDIEYFDEIIAQMEQALKG